MVGIVLGMGDNSSREDEETNHHAAQGKINALKIVIIFNHPLNLSLTASVGFGRLWTPVRQP